MSNIHDMASTGSDFRSWLRSGRTEVSNIQGRIEMSSIHDVVNIINSGDVSRIFEMLFGEHENVRRAAYLTTMISGEFEKDCEKDREKDCENVLEKMVTLFGDDCDDVVEIAVDYLRVMEACNSLSKVFLPLLPQESGDCVICYDEIENCGGKCAECKNVFQGGCFGAALSMSADGDGRCPFCRAKVTFTNVTKIAAIVGERRRRRDELLDSKEDSKEDDED